MKRAALFGAASTVAIIITGAAQAQTSAASGTVEEVVVTGSRIARPGFEAPTPVTAVQTDDLARVAPGAIADGLNQLPQFQNSTTTTARSTGTAGAQNTGNYLNMRALGTNRVLVLEDGQRMAVSGNNGGVDVSLVPSMLIERVEVVTGGASAVYGSDAVSGVVNFVLNKHLTNILGVAQAGLSAGGNIPSYRFGVAGGVALLDDRMHIVASAERYYTGPLHRQYFPIMAQGWTLNGAGTAASPFVNISGTRSLTLTEQGIITSGPLVNQQFTPSGNLVPFNPGTPTSIAGVNIGGDGGYFSQTAGTTGSSQEMNQFFIRPEMDFGDGITGFVSVGYNTSQYLSNPGGGFIRSIVMFAENPFLTTAERAALPAGSSFNLGRIFTDGPMHDIKQSSESLVVNAGLSGTIWNDFKWNINYGHSETNFKSSQRDIEFSKFYAAVDAVRDPAGNIVCRVTLDPDPNIRARYQGCVPLNPFGNGNGSKAAYDYFWGTSQWATTNKMDSIQGTLAGDLFALPAGPLSFAVGGEYRELSLVQTSNADPRITIDYTGLRGVLTSQLAKFRLTNNGVASGSQSVTEGFAELDAPLFKDTAFGSLDVNAAARVTDYSTSGQVTTWKLGAVFDPMEGVRFRTNLSSDIRAPSLFELFAAQQNVSQSFSDPLTKQNIGIQLISGGNASLVPENARTFTIGTVLKPDFIPGLSFSADYYHINITNAIAAPFTAQQILDLCAASNYTSSVCNSVVRPLGASNPAPNNTPSAILLTAANLASQLVSGIDFEADYGFDLWDGHANVRTLATNMLEFSQTNAVGQPVRQLLGTADFAQLPLPRWRGLVDFTYVNDGWTAGIQERIIGGFQRSHTQVYAANQVPEVFYTDVNLSYKLPETPIGQFELFAVIVNLLDKAPPLTPSVQTAPGLNPPYFVNLYDITGRSVTAGIRIKY